MRRFQVFAVLLALVMPSCGDEPVDAIVGKRGATIDAGDAGNTAAGSVDASNADASRVKSGCATDSDCAPPTAHCKASKCVECLSSADCGAGLVCAEPSATCATRCTSNDDCHVSKPVCDKTTGVCGNCRSNSDCPFSAAICEPTTGACVECLEDSHCPDRAETCSGLHTCAVYCGQGQLQRCPADNPICDQDIGGFCVECTDDTGCPFGSVCRNSECSP